MLASEVRLKTNNSWIEKLSYVTTINRHMKSRILVGQLITVFQHKYLQHYVAKTFLLHW
jgi:hypothetical protein